MTGSDESDFNPLDMMSSVQDSHPTPSATPPAAPVQEAAPAAPVAPAAHVAPAPGTTAAAAKESDPTTTADADPATAAGAAASTRAPGRSVYAVRQLTAVVAVVAAIVGVMWLRDNGIPGAAPSPQAQAAGEPGTARDATRIPGMAESRTDQDRAARWFRTTGSYDGFTTRGPGARSAAAGSVLVASRATDGVCLIYAMNGPKRTDVTIEQTGAACTDTEIVATQKALDQQSNQVDTANRQAAEDAFAHMAETAQMYSAGVFSNGQPSLAGLPPDLIPGVRITQNTGTSLAVVYDDGAGCFRSAIGVDGTVGDIAPC